MRSWGNMMRSNRSFVGTAIEIMSEALLGYITSNLNGRIPGGDWTQVLRALDSKNGKTPQKIEQHDLSAQIRILTTNLGSLGYLVRMDSLQRGMLFELRDIRNRWAHGGEFDAADLQRAMDTSKRILRSLHLNDGAEKIDLLIQESNEATGPSPANAAQPGKDSIVNESAQEESSALIEELTDVDLKIEVFCSSAINYATVQARFSIIDRIILEYTGVQLLPVVVKAVVTSGETNVSMVVERHVDLSPGTITLHDLDLELDPELFSGIDSRRPGKIVVQVHAGDVLIVESRKPVELLPWTHWTGTNTQAEAELLAAFVQPQHPEITGILSEVSDLLLERTGTSKLEGHQGGPERVDAIVEAVFEVLGQRQIRYSNPPASWELAALGGQHVRSAEEVLTNRFGTCLDTTVLFASVLEQIDINSTLWLVQGHAFLAYWRMDTALASSSLDAESAGTLFNLLGADKLRIVETTALTSEKKASIRSSAAATHRNFGQGEEAAEMLEYVVDIRQARISGIYPLPAKHVSTTGHISVVEYRPSESKNLESFLKEKASRDVPTPLVADSAIPPRIVQWKNGLLDMSLRNRLLNFTKTARFPLAVPARAAGSFEDLVSNGKALEILPEDSIGAVDQERYKSGTLLPEERRIDLLLTKGQVYAEAATSTYKSKLRKIASDAKTILDQSGANNLYLAMGTLLWNLDGKELRSPLILIPVTLQPAGRGGHFRVVRDEADASTPNYCLAEKLRERFNFTIPKFENPEMDSSGIDLDGTLEAVTQSIIDADLPFHVEKTVDLAILQFAKFRMWKDLDENWSNFLDSPLVKHLVETPTSEYADRVDFTDQSERPSLDEMAALLPVSADASQIEAVASAAEGRTFVLEGPPGTGKSQTITNLLAHSMASGKRVLFVAEKKAALEVVSRRLNEVGLGAYALDLHDKAASPNEVRKQIRDSIDHVVYADEQGMQLVKSDLRASRRKLALYASHVHDENVAGHSAYSAYNSSLVVDSSIQVLPISEKFASQNEPSRISLVRDAMSQLPETAESAVPRKDHPWGFLDHPMSDETMSDVTGAVEKLRTGLEQTETINSSRALYELVLSSTEPLQVRLAADLLASKTPLEILDEIKTPTWKQRVLGLIDRARELLVNSAWLPTIVDPAVLFMDLLPVREAAIEAESSGFLGLGKNKRRMQVITEHFGDRWRGTEENAKNLVELISGLIQARSTCAELVSGFGKLPGIKLESDWSPFVPGSVEQISTLAQGFIELGETTAMALDKSTNEAQITNLRAVLSDSTVERETAATLLASIADAWTDLDAAIDLQGGRVKEWSGDRTFMQAFSRTLQDLDKDRTAIARSLHRWNAFITALETLREHNLHEARVLLRDGEYDAEDALRGFMKGTAEAALKERLGTNALDDFNEGAHLRNIDRFRESSKDIRKHLVTALPAQIDAYRAPHMRQESNRLGELQRQLSKRRGGLSVRQLMTKYGDLVTTIMPCVLVSPDSAARFFPATAGQFDVVVFDEASQIRVADAIGALGRSKSAVVVGDSKQMPPTSFGGSAFDDESDDSELAVVADEESILSECVQARVPRQWLSWHYRSQDEALIAFSNTHYYDGKLSSFPGPSGGLHAGKTKGSGISLTRINGKFHRSGPSNLLRTNPVEAEAIVAEIRRRFAASPNENPSLGVITFNVQQRNYIENLIRDLGDERLIDALDSDSEGLFVKNLENVQGDERDVILFSTAFSVNDSGKLPLNFGPLNNAGGERRLNVAVTRARRQVCVFSSFAPEDLRAENSSSVGIKHLRAYLDLAAQGTRSLEDQARHRTAEDRYRDVLAEEIRRLGYFVESNIGLSEFKIDLTIATKQRPQEPLLAVLMDNETWAQRKTVGDRDGLPEEVLVGLMKWQSVLRVWLPAWLKDPSTVLSRVSEQMKLAEKARDEQEKAAESATQQLQHEVGLVLGSEQDGERFEESDGYGEPATTQSSLDLDDSILVQIPSAIKAVAIDESTVAEAKEIVADSTSDEMRGKYNQWNSRIVGTSDELEQLTSRRTRMKAADLLGEIVGHEWPVNTKRLSKLANGAFGLGKVSAARDKAMLRCLDSNAYQVDRDNFVWPIDVNIGQWRGYRSGFSENGLSFSEISPREVSNVLCHLISTLGLLESDELKREAMTFFGYKRLTTGISTHVQLGLDLAVDEGRLLVENEQVTMPSN
ncbi:DUF4011 domain-containing protein [Glutamicibacter arilaitensis]|uniref:DUF4011 domain-containing protein n=1 Tax=Glutamicibacter arilaitensis TaxID=256701 RepID=UPI003FD111D3